ncbi:MAG: flagellar motor stator protein MotA [Verrucomicrobiia bacterium]
MIIIAGAIVVTFSVLGGFIMAGGNPITLMHISELVIIGGAAMGALITMSPKKVLMDIIKKTMVALKGNPHGRVDYEDLLKALYELFMIARRNGMIALEDHVVNPETSSILTKYPSFLKNKHAVEFLCGSLRPVIDGKVKPEQLKMLMEIEIERMEEEIHAPVNVLTRTADSMPGFGIVAAVLGIVLTMAAISGPIEQIGEKVAAALVGTFLGILMAYGYLNPLAVKLEFVGKAELDYIKCIASAVSGFASGMAPIMAIELARRGLESEVKPSADELEAMVKSISVAKA